MSVVGRDCEMKMTAGEEIHDLDIHLVMVHGFDREYNFEQEQGHETQVRRCCEITDCGYIVMMVYLY